MSQQPATDEPRGPLGGRAAPSLERGRLTWVIAAVCSLAVLGNLASFGPGQADLADPHSALVRAGSNSLHQLTLDHGRNVGSRFTLATWLRQYAPGAEVVVAPGHPLVLEELIGLGRARPELREYSATLDPDEAEALLAAAVITDWYWVGPRDFLGSEETTGVPPAFRRGDFAVVGVPLDVAEPVRLVTYWTTDTVFLVAEDLARERRLTGVAP